MKTGLECLLDEPVLRAPLKGARVALLAHPASVTKGLVHAMDALAECEEIQLTAAFGPQHGLKGDKQDNMVESDSYNDPTHNIPVFSLYGEVRRPTAEMMEHFDVLLVDLQDLGCRIYTFITTLLYVLEEAAKHKKAVWILDRPNPAGRPTEGTLLREGWQSFVGADHIPMRHGLTMGEMAKWFIQHNNLDVACTVIEMEDWFPKTAPGYGWPTGERSWINPSPNAPNLSMARTYAGTVMLEGTTLSEGRGTTRPLEIFGAPDIEPNKLLRKMHELAPKWLAGCRLRECWFEPTFHKYEGQLCGGVQIHVDDGAYDHNAFRPWRLMALAFKALRSLRPDYEIWRHFPYEYEHERLAIDLINGSELLREWVDDHEAAPGDLDAIAKEDEHKWREATQPLQLY